MIWTDSTWYAIIGAEKEKKIVQKIIMGMIQILLYTKREREIEIEKKRLLINFN